MGIIARTTTDTFLIHELIFNWVNINSLFNLMGVATPVSDLVIFNVAVQKPSGAKIKFPLADINPISSVSGDAIGFGFDDNSSSSSDITSTIVGFTIL